MTRYELVEGSASKFWEVAVTGDELTVRFGRIGTAGQTKTKTFADAAAAQREHDKLVREKTGKGYGLVDDAGTAAVTAAPAAAPAKAAKTAPPPPAAEDPVDPPPVHAVEPATVGEARVEALSAIAWPRGGFQWNDEWRVLLPIIRGIHVPPFAIDPAAPDGAPQIDDQDQRFHAVHVSWRHAQFSELATAAGRPWQAWDATALRQHTTRESLSRRDVETWIELLAQLSIHGDHRRWSFDAGLALHGPVFMLEVVVTLAALATGANRLGNVMHPMLAPLRHAIAAADAAAWQPAFEIAAALRERTEPTAAAAAARTTRLLCAYLFPEREDWVAECIDGEIDDPTRFLLEGVMTPQALIDYLRRRPTHFFYLKPALLLQMRLRQDAALPAVAAALASVLADRDSSKETVLEALELFTAMGRPEVITQLGPHIDNLQVRGVLDGLAREFPAAVLLTAVQRALATRSRATEGWAVRLALRVPAALPPVLAVLEPSQRERFEATLAALAIEETPMEHLPAWLRHPAWLDKRRAQELPQLDLTPLPSPDRFDWTESQLEAFRHYAPPAYIRISVLQTAGGSIHADADDRRLLAGLSFNEVGIAALMNGASVEARHFVEGWVVAYADSVLLLQDHDLALRVWNGYPQAQWRSVYTDRTGVTRLMLARHGAAALPGLVRHVQSNVLDGLPHAAAVDSLQLVPSVLHALTRLKKGRAPAIDWISAHPRTTLIGAIPAAFGKDRQAAVNAQQALRWMADNGFAEPMREVAAEYGGDAVVAAQAVLDADPMHVLPARMPKLPTFFVPASFRRPELREGGALPVAAIEHIGSMLAISKADAPYAGLERVREACTPGSLAEFAWDLFEAWAAAGSPAKENWAFGALGHFGDDETARRLAPKIREWPGESAHARAVMGLDLLAMIGTDVALMHLNGIAGKVKFKPLQERAREKIGAVAEARGFAPDELSDRLVPDLGLDDDGTLTLDFGPRRFSVAFDEALKPFVRDAQGTRLKDLPKPSRSDDEALAAAATERFKQVRKDAKAIAALQITRLEMGMVARRRWPAADFRLFFIEHPLMRHLAARLVWGVYADGVYTRGLRIAEDGTLADRDDALLTLPDDASIGIAHVLEMPAGDIAAFGQVFADYEILQPFRQIGRETFALSDAERAVHETTRFAHKTVATGSVLGLINRGWERGEAQDAGWVGEFTKPLPDGLEGVLQLDPGTVVGDPSYEPKQKLPSLGLRKRRSWDAKDQVRLADLHPITASELLRDIELLAAMKD